MIVGDHVEQFLGAAVDAGRPRKSATREVSKSVSKSAQEERRTREVRKSVSKSAQEERHACAWGEGERGGRRT